MVQYIAYRQQPGQGCVVRQYAGAFEQRPSALALAVVLNARLSERERVAGVVYAVATLARWQEFA